MNDSYCFQILQDHLIPNTRRQVGRRWRLQRDNDPKHRSRLAQHFLPSEAAEVIDWLSIGSHANTVKNFWSFIKRHVEKRKATNIEEFNKFLDEEWVKVNVVAS